MNQETSFSSIKQIVLQINPELPTGNVELNGLSAPRIPAIVYIPNNNGNYFSCPLNYFQTSASLAEQWILGDYGDKLTLDYVNNIEEVIITEIVSEEENIIDIPNDYNKRLLNYFKLDIYQNPIAFKGFDCYAFISLIADVKHNPNDPEFNYEKGEPVKGDFIVLGNSNLLPGSLRHAALYLGNDCYLSKFGRSGEGKESLLSVMNLDGMKKLFKSDFMFIAKPRIDAKKWDGYIAN